MIFLLGLRWTSCGEVKFMFNLHLLEGIFFFCAIPGIDSLMIASCEWKNTRFIVCSPQPPIYTNSKIKQKMHHFLFLTNLFLLMRKLIFQSNSSFSQSSHFIACKQCCTEIVNMFNENNTKKFNYKMMFFTYNFLLLCFMVFYQFKVVVVVNYYTVQTNHN